MLKSSSSLLATALTLVYRTVQLFPLDWGSKHEDFTDIHEIWLVATTIPEQGDISSLRMWSETVFGDYSFNTLRSNVGTSLTVWAIHIDILNGIKIDVSVCKTLCQIIKNNLTISKMKYK